MFGKQSLQEILSNLHQRDEITAWHTIGEKQADYADIPDGIHPKLKEALINRGIPKLYTHQKEALTLAENKESFVTVTPTASGKTLCYNLPVLQRIIEKPETRALYIFPTKALSQDQTSELNEWIKQLELPIKGYTYDGDTKPAVRQKVREAGHVVITNPDMLHSAILPHHTKWVSLFENLQYIVIDELHTYRGVFGSHVANVLRRLVRIARYYGSEPQFISTSATIQNPKELAEQLTGETVEKISTNGAPRGKKHFVMYNPPVVNQQMNIRRSATKEAQQIAGTFLANEIQTIVFAKSRVRVELIVSRLQELVRNEYGMKSIQAYRGGYLPNERRAIEKGLREGEIRGVVSTNALELGMDIGQLQAAVLTGFPGTVASTWQQAGRAGRREDESVVVWVADASPIDQYMAQNPNYFLNATPEEARIQPDNLVILVDHIKCSAYELPFKQHETFGGTDVEDVLAFLNDEGVLHERAGKWYWMSDGFPAHNISLRSASQENIIIIDQARASEHAVIGEMDRFSAMTLLHEEAIYLHQGQQHQVEMLDWEEKKAYVRPVDVEYFTDANLNVRLQVIDIDHTRKTKDGLIGYGDAAITIMPSIFKKLKLSTHENIGSGPIHLPQEEIHTTAAWLELNEAYIQTYGESSFESGLLGVSRLLEHVVPVYTMSDRSDVHVAYQVKADHSERPTIFLYDHYPGGIGLADQVYQRMEVMIEAATELLTSCQCSQGCPSCIGYDENGVMKPLVEKLLQDVQTAIQ
ncbi:DEAD/DEAH box helicase domain-containing protein [Salsuginibacillus halophilus]|uniref:DEAD/DEAH box helicase domain-containing protein n=1 Tax=Salsuginibacillus halophilus TaxID=517424 RepID=A0A2P8HYS7_9BACI|nr:DEAD/DEAH box helicase [Salsuginibacillus halophilus]PSL51353.1 DEAD/DEAH box helicase domain-containing protein [Salsuginibacillus halophilus]